MYSIQSNKIRLFSYYIGIDNLRFSLQFSDYQLLYAFLGMQI